MTNAGWLRGKSCGSQIKFVAKAYRHSSQQTRYESHTLRRFGKYFDAYITRFYFIANNKIMSMNLQQAERNRKDLLKFPEEMSVLEEATK